jgi:2-iminobutanoate/2-iminopropanoate deaminase
MGGKVVIETDKAPRAAGPYSQGVIAHPFVFVSGMIPLDPRTGAKVAGDIEAQATRAMENLGAVLAEAGCSFSHVVRLDLLLADISDFPAVNRVLAGCFPENPPARVTSQAAALPLGVGVEIAAIAMRG